MLAEFFYWWYGAGFKQSCFVVVLYHSSPICGLIGAISPDVITEIDLNSVQSQKLMVSLTVSNQI